MEWSYTACTKRVDLLGYISKETRDKKAAYNAGKHKYAKRKTQTLLLARMSAPVKFYITFVFCGPLDTGHSHMRYINGSFLFFIT